MSKIHLKCLKILSVNLFRASGKIEQKNAHTLLTQVSHTAHNILASKFIEKITHAQLKDVFLLKHMQILKKICKRTSEILSTEHSQYLYLTNPCKFKGPCF